MNNDKGLNSIRGNLEIIGLGGNVTYPSEITDVNVEVTVTNKNPSATPRDFYYVNGGKMHKCSR